jgi:phospholipase C
MTRLTKSRLAWGIAAALLPFAAQSGAPQSNHDHPGHQFTQPPGHAKPAALVTLQPDTNSDIQPYLNDPSNEPKMSPAALQQLLRKKIKYVFVIFNENHSFDNEYGTFPGVNGLYSDGEYPHNPKSNTQTYEYTDATSNQQVEVTVHPFLIGPDENASVVDSVDHSHNGLAKKIDVVNGVAQMDQFAQDEFQGKSGAKPDTPIDPASASFKKGAQYANLVMSHIDCNTIPFFWNWANHFTIFDNIFATEDTPSTPNAIAMIAGQSGETQWVKHPSTDPNDPTATGQMGTTTGSFLQNTKKECGSTSDQSCTAGANDGKGLDLVSEDSEACPSGSCPPNTVNPATSTTQGPPLVNDPQPWYGSAFDTTATLDDSSGQVSGDRQPYGPYEGYSPSNTASNLTFASVPLTLMGRDVASLRTENKNPGFDLTDIQQDIDHLTDLNLEPVDWRWYQEGYGHEDSDPTSTATHWSYVSHRQDPQYFGYLANTPSQAANLKSETDFFTDIAKNDLPNGGVFYIRGGYYNQMQLSPAITNPNFPASLTESDVASINNGKAGDDDHPSYTDRRISEAMAARVINAIGNNPDIWSQSAIVITYDESDGFYDHVPPRILSYGPDGLPQARGVRVPLILISPYARTHAVSHAEGDHNSVIETINAIFNRPALASLPDEAQALKVGDSPDFNKFGPAGFHQKYLGPRDINSPTTDSLLSGFDPKRLLGIAPPLPPSFAKVPDDLLYDMSNHAAYRCSDIGMTPVEPAGESEDYAPPTGFNNLPSTLPQYN